MNNHPSFHGNMNDKAAENKLRKHGESCYLTRYSRSRKKLRLSVLRKKRDKLIIEHNIISFVIRVEKDAHTYEIEGTENKFDDISYFLSFYQNQPINTNIDGIGQYIQATESTDSHDTIVRAPHLNTRPQPNLPEEDRPQESSSCATLIRAPHHNRRPQLTLPEENGLQETTLTRAHHHHRGPQLNLYIPEEDGFQQTSSCATLTRAPRYRRHPQLGQLEDALQATSTLIRAPCHHTQPQPDPPEKGNCIT